jgi:GTP-dependent phosphoenolpyruvate carboxykinase
MRWAGNVAQVRTVFWWAHLREGNYIEGKSLEGTIILKWVFKRWDGRNGLDRSELSLGMDGWQF